MWEIKDLDAETIADGFCVAPYAGAVASFERTGSNLEEALAERRRFLTDRLAAGTAWGKIAYEDGVTVGWVDCFPAGVDGWVTIGCVAVARGAGGRGIGTALVNAVVEEARARGTKGVTVGATVWDHMPKGFFAKCGFADTDEKADMSRMILKLGTAEDPRFPEAESLYRPELEEGKVVVDLIRTGKCPTIYQTHSLVKRAAEHFPGKVIVNEYATSEPEIVGRFGKGGCGTYVNGEAAFFGYPGDLDGVTAFLRKKVDETEQA
jgi:GNAT superfamily N-acetyltransferase